MRTLRVLVVDDEPPARRKLIRFLNAGRDIELCAAAGTVADAVAAIGEHRPDLVFLDVQLPDGEGFDVIRALPPQHAPYFIFVTAHDHYALRAFEVHALDYLLKPADQRRFETAIERARRRILVERSAPLRQDLEALLRDLKPGYPARILLDLGEKSIFAAVEAIEYIESARNYLDIHSEGRTYTVRATLDSFAAQLDPEKFVRINRSQIVNIDAIREMQPWFHGEYRVVLHNGPTLTWTRRFSPGRTGASVLR